MFCIFPISSTVAEESPYADKPTNGACNDGFCDDEFGDNFEDEFSDEESTTRDPIEPFNRAMFWFNDKLYTYILKPVARAVRLIPAPARISVNNFFTNLEHPVYAVNSALQLKFKDSGTNLARFGINTTIGLLGFFDPAQHVFKLREHHEDFGQTLGRYGLGTGFYIVIPLLGPTNLRDLTGQVVDFQITPSHLILDNEENELIYRTVDSINEFSLDKDTYEIVTETALDPYLFVRDAYLVRRQKQIQQ